jgi:hypothetical protein
VLLTILLAPLAITPGTKGEERADDHANLLRNLLIICYGMGMQQRPHPKERHIREPNPRGAWKRRRTETHFMKGLHSGRPPDWTPPWILPLRVNNRRTKVRKTEKKRTRGTNEGLRVGTVNVQGIYNKTHKVDALMLTENLDVLALQELKLQPLRTPPFVYGTEIIKEYPIPGMRGLAFVYDRRVLEGMVTVIPTDSSHTHAIFIATRPVPTLLINVYCPPKDTIAAAQVANDLSHLYNIYGQHANIVVMGDFNVNLREGSSPCHRILKAAVTACGMNIATPSNPDTTTWRKSKHDPDTTRSTLDFVLYSGPVTPSRSKCSFEDLGDHALLTTSFDIDLMRNSHQWVERWNLRALAEDPSAYQSARD